MQKIKPFLWFDTDAEDKPGIAAMRRSYAGK